MARMKDGDDEALPVALLDEDFGLLRDLPDASRWINPAGDAVSSRGQIELLRRAGNRRQRSRFVSPCCCTCGTSRVAAIHSNFSKLGRSISVTGPRIN